jgi:hypothetical protein
MRVRHRTGLAVALCAGILAGPGPALADTIHVTYRALLGDVDVGVIALAIEIEGERYRLAVDGLLAESDPPKGVRGKAHAAGRLARGGLLPDLYSAGLDKAGVKTSVALGFSNGTVGLVAVLPPEPGGSGKTAPPANQNRGLIDPLSALAIPAAASGLAPLSACGRTQRVFDGTTRYDVTLFPSRVETIALAGEMLTTLVCRAEMRPGTAPPPRLQRWPEIASQWRRAVIWFAPVGDGRLLVPARFETDLALGKLVIETTAPRAFGMASPAALR